VAGGEVAEGDMREVTDEVQQVADDGQRWRGRRELAATTSTAAACCQVQKRDQQQEWWDDEHEHD
jgi:hypothetical protein